MQRTNLFAALLVAATLVGLALALAAPAQADTGITQLDQWTATSTPSAAVTQRIYGKPIKITGLTTGLCLTLDANNLVTTTTCGSSGGNTDKWATSTDSVSIQPNSGGGIIVSASSTIGNGTQAGGLTINGGATTTANAYFGSKVGIGTSTPGDAITILGTSNGHLGTATPIGITLADTSTGSGWDTVNPWAKLDFYSSDASSVGVGVRARIGALMTTTGGGATRLGFFTSPSTAGTMVEQMTLMNNGVLGLGTTTPRGKLHIEGTSNSTSLNTQTTNAIAFVQANTSTTDNSFAGNDYATYDSAGAFVTALRIASIFKTHAAGDVNGDMAFSTAASSTLSEVMRLTATNRVGIGLTAPVYKLDVSSTIVANDLTSSTTLRLGGLLSSNTWSIDQPIANLDFYNNDTSSSGAGVRGRISSLTENALGTNWSLGFNTSLANATPTEKMRITSSGNVGIGTTSPSQLLSVGGAAMFTGNVGINTFASLSSANLIVSNSSQFDPSDVTTGNAISVLQTGGTPALDAYGAGLIFTKIASARRGGAIASVQTTSDADQLGLAFFTHGSANTGDTVNERMRLTHGGLLGIATTTPGSLLSVQGVANFNTATSSFYSTGGINLLGGGCFAINGTCVSGAGGGVSSVSGTYPVISSGGATPAISLAFGTTTANSWSALNTFANATSTLFTCTTCWLTTATITNASTTNLSASQSLFVGNNQVSGERYASWGNATSTTWTASTTIHLDARFAGTLGSIKCFTDTGTLNVQAKVNSTYVIPMFNASTTKGKITFTSSNTFVDGDDIAVEVGTPASTPTSINCTAIATGF